MIITIARQCGCQGDEIGQKLAEEYGLSFYNKEHIVRLAKEKGIYEKFPYFFSEIPVNALMHTISDDEGNILLSEAKKALYPLIGDENCVIIGRCANYAFADRKDKISVFLSGDREARIKHIAEKPQEYTPGANKSPAQREPYGAMVISGVSPDPKGEEPAAEGYTSKAMLTPPYRVIVAHTPGQVNP